MTSTASFKDKIKQILSVFLWELQACKGTLIVYTILAAVFTIIIFTISIVGSELLNFTDESISLSAKMTAFQIASATVISVLTTIFTIFYTIRVFSYMHDKRKADFYGPLPISRARMYLSKTLSAYLFSVVPALFFISLIAILSVCTGTEIQQYVTNIFFNTIVGTLACTTSYGLVATCCGTTLNSVIMYLVVCLSYPVSMSLLTAIIKAFYPGFYTGLISDSFVAHALNPLAAYNGKNILYWIVFSIACVVGATILVMKRKSERAQTSFAYYLPCYLVKILVSFICGALLGCIFAVLNVLGAPLLGFIFGFLLASVPSYIITHLIFYHNFRKLLVTSIPLAAMLVIVTGGSVVFNFDLFGYNSYVPDIENVKSAGIIDTDFYMPKGNKSLYKVSKKSAKDITDKELIEDIISAHEYFAEYNKIGSKEKFANVWGSMLSNVFGDFDGENAVTITYKLNNGMTVSRYYDMTLSPFDSLLRQDDTDVREEVQIKAFDIFRTKEYILKYSGTANADFSSDKAIRSIKIFALDDNDNVEDAEIKASENLDVESFLGEDKEKSRELMEKELEKQAMMLQITKALIKDLKEDETKIDTVLFDPYSICYLYDNKASDFYREKYSDDYYSFLSPYSGTLFKNVSEIDKDIVCQITVNTKGVNSLLSASSNIEETFYIPSSYTNTLNALRKCGIIDENNKINENSEFADITEFIY